MKLFFRLTLVMTLSGLVLTPASFSQDAERENQPLPWIAGPTTMPIGDGLAEVEVPEGFLFLGQKGTVQLMELTENPVSGGEMATLTPESDEEAWFLVFEWDDIGWVDDSERELDAEELISSLREGNDAGNKERLRRGWPTLEIVGWKEEPHYDAVTNNLTWAIQAESEGHPVINKTVKLLGRRGTMTATLVAGPEELDSASTTTDELLMAYSFRPGSRYAEYIPGTDRAAEIGLAALVVGGGAAVLVKSGLLARFWKLIVVGALAVAGGLRRIFMGPKHIADPPSGADVG